MARAKNPADFEGHVLEAFILVFIPLLVLVDPPASLGLFLGLTEGHTNASRRAIAAKATVFAAAVLIMFAAAGNSILDYLGIELHALQIAGGIMLLIIGLRMLREGREIPKREIHLPTGGHKKLDEPDGDPSFVPLGLPMLAGPGAISLVIVQSTQSGLSLVALSILCVMTIACLALVAATGLQRAIGDTGTRVITRIMGIIVVAFAVQYVLDGLDGWKLAGGGF